MESCFSQKLELAYVAEPIEAVDVAGIFASGHTAAVVLVVIDEFHQALVIVAPRDFVLGGPVVPIGAFCMGFGASSFWAWPKAVIEPDAANMVPATSRVAANFNFMPGMVANSMLSTS